MPKADEREFRYAPHSEVAAYVADGWTDTGESEGHHGAHSHILYRYVEPEEPAAPNPLLPHRPQFIPKVSRSGEHVILILPHGSYQLLPHEALRLAAAIGEQVFGNPPFVVP